MHYGFRGICKIRSLSPVVMEPLSRNYSSVLLASFPLIVKHLPAVVSHLENIFGCSILRTTRPLWWRHDTGGFRDLSTCSTGFFRNANLTRRRQDKKISVQPPPRIKKTEKCKKKNLRAVFVLFQINGGWLIGGRTHKVHIRIVDRARHLDRSTRIAIVSTWLGGKKWQQQPLTFRAVEMKNMIRTECDACAWRIYPLLTGFCV